MPTLEFFGFQDAEKQQLESRIRAHLEQEPFRDDCVFVDTVASKVRDWAGRERPFVRVSTRSGERAGRFKVVLGSVCDLEVVLIDFQPMEAGTQDEL